jgi:hypothetical protein
VLAELAERLEARRLLDIARTEGDLPNVQRLGHLLDQTGGGESAAALYEWVAAEQPRFVALRPGHSTRRATRDARWRVLVNEKVEPEA